MMRNLYSVLLLKAVMKTITHLPNLSDVTPSSNDIDVIVTTGAASANRTIRKPPRRARESGTRLVEGFAPQLHYLDPKIPCTTTLFTRLTDASQAFSLTD